MSESEKPSAEGAPAELPQSKIPLMCASAPPGMPLEDRIGLLEQRLSMLETAQSVSQVVSLMAVAVRSLGERVPQQMHEAYAEVSLFAMHLSRDSLMQQREVYEGVPQAKVLREGLEACILRMEQSIMAVQKKIDTGTAGPSRIVLAR